MESEEKKGLIAEFLGSSYRKDIRGEDVRGYQRPSWEEAEKFREKINGKVKAMSMEEIHNFAATNMPDGLEAIANSKMPLADIPKFRDIVDIIRDNLGTRLFEQRYQGKVPPFDEMFEEREEIYPEEELDYKRFDVAAGLAYSVVLSEGLLGPNKLGYVPDLTLSLYHKEEIVMGNIERVVETLSGAPNMFGEKTRNIYEGITNRLKFPGRRVMDKNFPPFPQQNPVQNEIK